MHSRSVHFNFKLASLMGLAGVFTTVAQAQEAVRGVDGIAGDAWSEPISPLQTVSNLVGPAPFMFREALSRALTVLTTIKVATFPFREAISRSHTVRNEFVSPMPIKEAISRSHTVKNDMLPRFEFHEAISRSHTVKNDAPPHVEYHEAISRASTVLNRPEVRLGLQSVVGDKTVYARCGETVPYPVVATVSDKNNDGLALVNFDVRYDAGELPPMDLPSGDPSCENPMAAFVPPAGITEATGFGGMPFPARPPDCGYPNGHPAGLKYVGGAQNTFNHTGDAPDGIVVTGVGQPSGCGPAVIAEGTLVVPSTPGEYRVWLENARANVIAKNATGVPSWRVRPALVNVRNELIVQVVESRCTEPCRFDFLLFTECFSASGPDATPAPNPPYMTMTECLGAFDEDNDGDVDLRDFAEIEKCYEPTLCTNQRVLSASSPRECAIDHRQPYGRSGANPAGFSTITLNMACPAGDLSPADFAFRTVQDPAAPAIRRMPTIQNATAEGRNVTLHLSLPIDPGRWTCFRHVASPAGTDEACIGFLPGDLNHDRRVDDADSDVLTGCLSESPSPCPLALCDINRDGDCDGDDMTRFGEMFDGEYRYDQWLGEVLPPCPSGP